MRCPKCKNTELECEKVTIKNKGLEQCPVCKGMWFENAELSSFLGVSETTKITIPNYATKIPNAKCSSCSEFLYEFCYPGTLVLIDGCKKCKFVWLDNKEWNSINHARDERNKISCPKCHMRQNPSNNCNHCGIVISKYQSNQEHGVSKSEHEIVSESTITSTFYPANSGSSYADNIPGVKGWLLRTNDKIIKWFSNELF